jgi:PAS domain S-box-containing protein
MGLYSAATAVWFPIAHFVHLPFPSVADALYLPSYATIVLALVLLVSRHAGRRDWGGTIDAVVVAVGLGVLSWVFLMEPYLSDSSLPILTRAVAVAYPFTDVLFVAVVARLLFLPGPRSPSYRFLMWSLMATMVADSWYAVSVLRGTFTYSSPFFACWLLFYVLLGTAALHPSMRGLSETRHENAAPPTGWRLAFLAAAALAVPVVTLVEQARGIEGVEAPAVVISGVMFVLVLIRVRGLGGDIRKLRAAETRLGQAEAEYRTLVERVPAVVYTANYGVLGEWPYVSPRIEEMLGYTPEEWVARPGLWAESLHPEDRDRVLEEEDQSLRTGAPIACEYRMLTRDGRVVWVRDEAAVARDAGGSPRSLQGFMYDITQRKRAEEDLERALGLERQAVEQLRALDDMKNTFLQAVSHDLRTPLTVIMGSALTLEREDAALSRNESRDLLHRLSVNAQKLNRLLTDLLDLDRLHRGIIQPSRQPTDLSELLRAVAGEADLYGDHPIEIDAEPMVAIVDRAKVERMVENLLVNAAKHTPPGTPIWVAAHREVDGVHLSVDDAGPGVPLELRQAVFEPFRQAGSPASHSPGVGIGLALVKSFAELHGGWSRVEESRHGGASFRVFLPDGPERLDSPGPSDEPSPTRAETAQTARTKKNETAMIT